MSYQLNKTDGTLLTELIDGQIDNSSTNLVLVGKNYSGYGEAFNENFIGFIETHGIKSDFYADNKLGFGIAYLLNDNLQLDFGTIFNFKETPTIFQMSLGVSYRLNLYKE